jgi:hypothetical protein
VDGLRAARRDNETLDRFAIETAARATRLVPAALGARAEVLGAVALAVLRSEADTLANS